MLLRKIVIAAICVAGCAGCLKGYDGSVLYVLKPIVSDGSVNKDIDRYIDAYAFYADTTRWTVASYDDALAMRVTDKATGAVLDAGAVVAEPFVEAEGGGRYALEMSLEPSTVMIVVVDTQLRLYGYREQRLSEGLKSIFDSVIFYTSRSARRYKAGQWMMCNDFYGQSVPDPGNGDDDEGGDGDEDNDNDDPQMPQLPEDDDDNTDKDDE